ncbi:MAG: hypothetical protein Q8P02_04085 [Candidatus Micrarchaeota archaeon]|nr:hypothetical protein [Candidatus Micrarchaeota archaeon]
MTNITLSVNDDVYKRMRRHSEIRWSEFVRKSIRQRLDELDRLNENRKESRLTMLASEAVLKKDRDNEKDARWDHV